MSAARNPTELLILGRPLTLASVADGAEGLVAADLARGLAARADATATSLAVVCRDGARMGALARALKFFAPDLAVQEFPAWDCLPYDRVSTHAALVAQRMTVLSRLVRGQRRGSVLLTTVNAALQRVPAADYVAGQSLSLAPGQVLAMDDATGWLEVNGFMRASTVREPGDYAVRGGIIDLYAPGMAEPVRLDFFGNTLETIRSFDPESQRTTDQLRGLDLLPVAEVQLTAETLRRFRLGYVEAFGAPAPDDVLYHAVSEGRRHAGMEHWLPLFHDGLDTLFDSLTGFPMILEPLVEEAVRERLDQIEDYYEARQQALTQRGPGPPYKPLPPTRLYLTQAEWRARLDATALARLTRFSEPEGQGHLIDIGTKQGRNFAAERAEPGRNVFEAVARHVSTLKVDGKRVAVALWSEGARERMSHVLADHGLGDLALVDSWPQVLALPQSQIALAVLGLESGFESAEAAIIGEQDILGDRLVRPRRAAKRAENFIAEVTSLSACDLVVHVDHGIGRFVGLRAIEAAGAPHGFPYEETEYQQASIDVVLGELSSGRPMDRLICGDVGFGKTEVALRAAFVAAMNGKQVAVVVPTTLLARQHTKTFIERFRDFPVKIGQASRLVSGKDLAAVKKGIAEGDIDIVVGTHALLGKAIKFRDLGLIIVDEEQHFGVGHKERLKQLRAEVHVITLTATPIPRTLQLALTGVRDLSIIASPPVDRLAVRTFVSPFDPIIVREALLREKYRGGQAFYVCPRIEDLAGAKDFLDKNIPEVRVAVAHGQMPPTVLDDIMSAFYDGKYDVLLSTTIIESELDIPSANTLIVHRADMFGLAQLYQLRGRVGRSKLRAYAQLIKLRQAKITPQAERRLKVLQSLETLGAGFQLASHDLDIRGAGNLLGEEQSGHIKEVGFELYQSMLEEAILNLKAGVAEPVADRWSPPITIGMPVLIPEDYVADLSVRLALYRRLADLDDERDIDGFAAELVDRFGPMPDEVRHLLDTVVIKALCRRANVAKIETSP